LTRTKNDWTVTIHFRNHRLKFPRHVSSAHNFTENHVYLETLIKNLTGIQFLLNHFLVPELYYPLYLQRSKLLHPKTHCCLTPSSLLQGEKWRTCFLWIRAAKSDKCEVFLHSNIHLRREEDLIIMNSALYSSSCLTIPPSPEQQ
jgi:hypothetical protein